MSDVRPYTRQDPRTGRVVRVRAHERADGGVSSAIPTSPIGALAASGQATAHDDPFRAEHGTDGDVREVIVFDERIDGASLRSRNLTGSEWVGEPFLNDVDMSRVRAPGTHIHGVFTNVTMSGANLAGANVDGTHFFTDFSGAHMTGARLPSVDGGDFSGADLRVADAMHRSFYECDFSGADLGGATFTSCSFHGADLSQARDVDQARFRGCYYDDATRFPDGYDAAAAGWTRMPLDDEVTKVIDRMRVDARAGEFTPWASQTA